MGWYQDVRCYNVVTAYVVAITILRLPSGLLDLVKMVYTGKISCETRAYVKLLRTKRKMSFRKIAKECKISESSAYRIVNGTTKNNVKHRKRTGRPRKIYPAMERHILRHVKKLRLSEGSFTIPRLMQVCGISEHYITRRTLLNVLHRNGYRFRQTRKKGLLNMDDLRKRLVYARRMLRRPAQFWCGGVAFYLDAVSFVHKTNPLDQAKAPKSRIYRKKGEGLCVGCTSKGKKEGTGGNYARFIVAISYGKGVIICEEYQKMTGAFFAKFIEDHFPRMFDVADKETDVFVQDGDPSQNSSAARSAMTKVNAQLLAIPPRSPDLNPIENFFHIVSEKLREEAILQQCTKESFDDFKDRIIRTMTSVPQETIDNTIASIRSRLLQIVASRGQRVKY